MKNKDRVIMVTSLLKVIDQLDTDLIKLTLNLNGSNNDCLKAFLRFHVKYLQSLPPNEQYDPDKWENLDDLSVISLLPNR